MATRTAICALVCMVTACASSPERRRRGPSYGPSTDELTELLVDFNRAMKEGEIDAAERILSEMERGIEQAPVSTITHPDYMRITIAIDRAAETLKETRGGASFGEWKTAARAAIEHADRLTKDLESRVTRTEHVALERLTKRLERLVLTGEAYRGEPQFAEVADPLEQRLIACGGLLERLRWQIEARSALAGPLGDANRAEAALAGAPADQRRQLTATLMAGFKSCAAVALLHASKVGASDAPLPTPYGQLPIRELQTLCSRRANEAAEQLAELRQASTTGSASDGVVADSSDDNDALPVIDPDGVVSRNSLIGDVHGDLVFSEREIERAAGADHAAVRVVALANALVALHRCSSRSGSLLARLRNLQPDAQEALTNMATRCRLQAARVETLLAATNPSD